MTKMIRTKRRRKKRRRKKRAKKHEKEKATWFNFASSVDSKFRCVHKRLRQIMIDFSTRYD